MADFVLTDFVFGVRRRFVLADFVARRGGVQAGQVQVREGRHGAQEFAGALLDLSRQVFGLSALLLRGPEFLQHGAAGAALEQWGQLADEHPDGAVDLAGQGGLVALDAVELVQALVFGQGGVLEELGLPAVQPPEAPGGGGDLLGVVPLQEVAGVDLGGELFEEGVEGAGVLAERGQGDVSGEESVGGGVAGADGARALSVEAFLLLAGLAFAFELGVGR